MKFVPLSNAGLEMAGAEGWAAVETQEISFSARQGKLESCSPSLSRFVIPFEVRIENKGQEKISFEPGDFVLLDENGRQYQPVDLSELYAVGQARERVGWVSPAFGFGLVYGWSPEAEEAAWGAGFPIWYYHPVAYDRCPEEIYLRVLSPQPIEPGAHVQGLVFFRGRVKGGTKLTLKLRKGTAPREVILELHFKVV